MCQAYEGEARLMRSLDESAWTAGFEAHWSGAENPYGKWDGERAQLFEYGKSLAAKGELPYGVECRLDPDHTHKWECPVCHTVVEKWRKQEHRLGFPCDGSNPLELQRKGWRRQRYEELRREFEG